MTYPSTVICLWVMQTDMTNIIYAAVDVDLKYSINISFMFEVVKENCKADKGARPRCFLMLSQIGHPGAHVLAAETPS